MKLLLAMALLSASPAVMLSLGDSGHVIWVTPALMIVYGLLLAFDGYEMGKRARIDEREEVI